MIHPVRVIARTRLLESCFGRLMASLLFACVHTAALAQAYTIVFGPENSAPSAIDNAGRIAGQLAGRAFLWDGAASLDIGTLGGESGTALALSDNGFVTGSAAVPMAAAMPSCTATARCAT